jgi:outer membrane protein TolC
MNTALQPTDKDRLKDLSPSLQIARQNAEASELSAKIAKSFMLPTLSVNGTYSYNRTQSQAGFALFNQSYGPSGGATLNMPLFQGGNLRRQAKVASLQAMRMQLTYDWQNTELSRQYRTAWGNYEMALAAYKLEQENIGYAKENLDIQKARFRVGIANTLETREAENSYVQALQRLFTAAYNLKVSETKVLELEGNLVK